MDAVLFGAYFRQIVGRGLVHIIVQPVRIQQLRVRAPGDARGLRRIVVREVVARQRHVQAFRDIALVLGHERVGVVLGVAEHEEVAAVGALGDVDAASSDCATISKRGSASMSSAYTVVWRECGAQKRSSNPRTSGLEA